MSSAARSGSVRIRAMGIGALVGTIVFGAIGHRIRLRPVFGLAFVLMGAPRFTLLAATDDLRVVLAGVFLCGIAAGAVDPIVSTVLLRRVPDVLQARVFGALTAAVLAAMPVGALLGGLLVETVGLRPALIAGGTCYLLVGLSPFVFSTWRALDESHPVSRIERLRPVVDEVQDGYPIGAADRDSRSGPGQASKWKKPKVNSLAMS